MLRTLATKPIALNWTGEAHAVRMEGYITFVAKYHFSFGIVAAAHGTWAGVARHASTPQWLYRLGSPRTHPWVGQFRQNGWE